MATENLLSPAQVKDNFLSVKDRIAQAAARAERKAEDVHLVAVTKYAMPDQIRALIDLGHADFGESRMQQITQRVPQMNEYLERQHALGGADRGDAVTLPDKLRWHMVGHMQRNKCKQVLPLVDLVHSVDSLRLCEEIHAYAAKHDVVVDVLLQINITGETTKSGVASPAAVHMVDQMDTMVHLRPRGLMTMAEHSDNPETARSTFRRLRELFIEIANSGVTGSDFNLLSMGMSNDFEIAVEEGSNVVRVGSAIFGASG